MPSESRGQTQRAAQRRPLRAWLPLFAALAGASLFVILPFASRVNEGTKDAGGSAIDIPNPDTTDLEPQVLEAIQNARRAVADNPSDPAIWKNYAMVLDAHELLSEAREAYQRVLTLDPEDLRASYLLAITLDRLGGHEEEAERLYRYVTGIQTGFPPANYRLGRLLYEQDRWHEARAELETALEIDANFVAAHREIGRVYVSIDMPEEAILHLEQANELQPDDKIVHQSLALAYERNGQPHKAREAAKASERLTNTIAPPDPVRYEVEAKGVSSRYALQRAVRLIEAGKLTDANAEIDVLRATRWDDPDIHLGLAGAYRQAGKQELALVHFQKAVELGSDAPGAHLAVASSLNERRKFADAVEHWRRAAGAFPDNAAVHIEFANALAATASLNEAIAHYAKGAEIEPPTAEVQTNWGTALMRSGNVSGAIAHYREAIRLDADYADAHFNLAYALEQSDQMDEAIAEYKLGAKLNPRHPAARRLKTLEQDEP